MMDSKKRTGNIEMKCLAGHLDSMEEEAITETPATEPAALTASTSAGDVSVDLEVAEGMAENPRMSTRSSSIRNNTLGWDGSTWEGDERLTDACTRMQSFLSVQQSPIKKTKSVNYSAKDPLQVGLIDIKLTIKEEKSLTSMFVKRAQSASPLGRTRKGRSPSRESIIPAIPRRKKILQGVSGAVGPGITAILGPSDAERQLSSTSLAGRKSTGSLSGKVVVSGKERTPSELRGLVGYVLQDDCARVHLLSANASCFTRCSDCAMM